MMASMEKPGFLSDLGDMAGEKLSFLSGLGGLAMVNVEKLLFFTEVGDSTRVASSELEEMEAGLSSKRIRELNEDVDQRLGRRSSRWGMKSALIAIGAAQSVVSAIFECLIGGNLHAADAHSRPRLISIIDHIMMGA